MLVTTGKILDDYDANQCTVYIVYGNLGYGKSSYSLKVLNELYDTLDWEKLKTHIVYTKLEFLTKIKEQKTRDKVLVWDDAGIALFNLDTFDPLIKNVIKWFSVARTQFSGIILTTPTPMWIVKKVRCMPQSVMIKITKSSGNKWDRTATAYRNWVSPDFKSTGVKTIYEDHFSCKLPDQLYKPYNLYREGYVHEIAEEIDLALIKEQKRDKKERGETKKCD